MASRSTPAKTGRDGELPKRLAVAVVMLPIVAWLIANDVRTSAALFSLSAAVACWEYYRLVFGGVPLVAWFGVVAAASLPLVPAFVASERAGVVLFVIVGETSISIWMAHLFAGPRSSAPERNGHILAGVLFCSVGLAALSALRAGRDGVAWTALVLVASWANDASAYFGGRAFGRFRLFASVSPGKTWEGFFAGMCGGTLALLIIRPLLPRYMTVETCVVLGLVFGVLGPVGDLCKSVLKRAYHVKDAGRLFPGHGGMLDRIDGILFIAPAAWIIRAAFFGG